MSHTKGPWFQPDYITWPAFSDKAQYPIHAKKRGRIGLADRSEDARLMAAAPTMYAFLQKCALDGNAEAAAILGAINA
jgi:hypothetical protein